MLSSNSRMMCIRHEGPAICSQELDKADEAIVEGNVSAALLYKNSIFSQSSRTISFSDQGIALTSILLKELKTTCSSRNVLFF